jgi:dsRNA-specific ribonuclease
METAARAFILRYWEPRATNAAYRRSRRDPKTELQEWAAQV